MLASYSGFLIYFLLHNFYLAAAIPTHKHIPHNTTIPNGNKTALRELEDIEKPWTRSPRRGTNDLLLSCAVTIALAVWLTPDATLPRPRNAQVQTDTDANTDAKHDHGGNNKKSIWQRMKWSCVFALKTFGLWLDPRHRVRWKYKALWAFLNVMLPELALAVALDEWRRSRELIKALHDLELQGIGGGNEKRTRLFAKWNMTMAFYAVMGGFYVPDLPLQTPSAADTGDPTPGMGEGDKESIRTLVGDTMPFSSSEYCNWSLVKRCCDVSEKRIEHRNRQSDLKKQKGNMSRAEMKKEKEDLDDKMKPRHVLTTHGVLYMARLLKDVQDCAERHMTDGYTGVDCGFRDPSKEVCNCRQYATILEDQFRDITSEIIGDLSKSDWMGRAFFLVQSGWMIIQTTARYFSNLPITLLELHASLHVAVAALQYIIWWRKPIDMVVMTPLSLPYTGFKMPKTEDITNYQFLDSHCAKLLGPISDTSSQAHNTVTSAPPRGPHSQGPSSAHDPINQRHPPSQSHPAEEHHQLLAGGGVGSAKVPHCREPGIQGWWSGLLEIEDSGQFSDHYFTSQSTLGKEGSKQIAGISIPHNPFHGIVLAVVHLTLSWQRWPFQAILWFCSSLIYSFAHLQAWHAHFPTPFEQGAWHWCTSFTTLCLALLSLAGLVASLYRFLRLWGCEWREESQKKSEQDSQLESWALRFQRRVQLVLADIYCSNFILGLYRHSVRAVGVGIAIGVIPWLLARLYISLESVISIRSVPKGTYDTVKWTTFIPHI